jgi:lipopolysaccharide biosynthesis protein
MTSNVRTIAFYLPQFHPIPENDEWWGKGFTEWTNVAKAKPLFPGHYQPHLPSDLGFYDLRLPATRSAQANLASEYGITGFCYWHYWFNGRRVLELPFNDVLSSRHPDFPFCLAWANENWTRRWDGEDHEILLAQQYTSADDYAHIGWLIGAFRDSRYIKIDGKPVFIIYRAHLLPNAAETAQRWREAVVKAGFPGLYLCMITGLRELDFDPTSIGFDAAVEFQPNWDKLPGQEPTPKNTLLGTLFQQFATQGREAYLKNKVISYTKLAETMMALPIPTYKLFPCVTPGWDNSPRRKSGALIFTNSDPITYGRWLHHAIRRAMRRYRGDERLVFINAWNEWAEGNHLEPDLKYGTRYLEETKRAINHAG